jgi:hypothetical protein
MSERWQRQGTASAHMIAVAFSFASSTTEQEMIQAVSEGLAAEAGRTIYLKHRPHGRARPIISLSGSGT